MDIEESMYYTDPVQAGTNPTFNQYNEIDEGDTMINETYESSEPNVVDTEL